MDYDHIEPPNQYHIGGNVYLAKWIRVYEVIGAPGEIYFLYTAPMPHLL
jgi:hypothetical protein